mgnify:CR=1 FL=1
MDKYVVKIQNCNLSKQVLIDVKWLTVKKKTSEGTKEQVPVEVVVLETLSAMFETGTDCQATCLPVILFKLQFYLTSFNL